MVSSPTFHTEIPLKAPEVVPETIDLESASVSSEEVEEEDLQQPAVLEKEETLISTGEIPEAENVMAEAVPGLAKYATIGSRRIDSLRFKEKTRATSPIAKTETRKPLTEKPSSAVTKEAIESEIDDLFKTILA
jgi:hypothetical protein